MSAIKFMEWGADETQHNVYDVWLKLRTPSAQDIVFRHQEFFMDTNNFTFEVPAGDPVEEQIHLDMEQVIHFVMDMRQRAQGDTICISCEFWSPDVLLFLGGTGPAYLGAFSYFGGGSLVETADPSAPAVDTSTLDTHIISTRRE